MQRRSVGAIRSLAGDADQWLDLISAYFSTAATLLGVEHPTSVGSRCSTQAGVHFESKHFKQ
jgi:hypothetical protein